MHTWRESLVASHMVLPQQGSAGRHGRDNAAGQTCEDTASGAASSAAMHSSCSLATMRACHREHRRAIPTLSCATADAGVLRRLLELLDIVCTRLQRCNGLVVEEYTPAADGAPWTPAPDTHINYGELQPLQIGVEPGQQTNWSTIASLLTPTSQHVLRPACPLLPVQVAAAKLPCTLCIAL